MAVSYKTCKAAQQEKAAQKMAEREKNMIRMFGAEQLAAWEAEETQERELYPHEIAQAERDLETKAFAASVINRNYHKFGTPYDLSVRMY